MPNGGPPTALARIPSKLSMITVHVTCAQLCVCVRVQTDYVDRDLIVLKQDTRLMSELPYGVIDEGQTDEHLMR